MMLESLAVKIIGPKMSGVIGPMIFTASKVTKQTASTCQWNLMLFPHPQSQEHSLLHMLLPNEPSVNLQNTKIVQMRRSTNM
jgi:hypothetical protein